MLLTDLQEKQLIHPPSWLVSNTQYLTIMGSYAYGVSNDLSDTDVYGFTIPPKETVFPHLIGEIPGFGNQLKRFAQWQEQHIVHKERNYDLSVYNIVKYFQLCMENNPNMLDSLFTDRTCILHCTQLANLVRENRHKFLHKGSWFKFKGYAYSQLSKIKSKRRESLTELQEFEERHNICGDYTTDDLGGEISERDYSGKISLLPNLTFYSLQEYFKLKRAVDEDKRAQDIKNFNFDLKFAYQLIRLLLEVEQILTEHDIDLRRNAELLKSIRKGEWDLKRVEDWFVNKEKSLEEVYNKSDLRDRPDESEIKQLLLNCLEMHYGSIDKIINIRNDWSKLNGKQALKIVEQMRELIK